MAYVVDTIAFATIPLDMRSESIHEALRKDGLDVTKGVMDTASEKGVDAEAVVLEGNRAGDAWKSGIERFLLGCVAEKITRTSPVPVMIVKGV